MTSINGDGPVTQTESIFVFRAPDWEAARERAIELGKDLEASYKNAAGESVTYRLLRIQTLDLLGDEIADGREVYSKDTPVDGTIDVDAHPEDSRPTHSGI